MAQCYLCYAAIPRGGGLRRWVPASRGGFRSTGRWGMRVGNGASSGVRTICDMCAIEMQRADARMRSLGRFMLRLLASVVVLMAIGGIVKFWSDTGLGEGVRAAGLIGSTSAMDKGVP